MDEAAIRRFRDALDDPEPFAGAATSVPEHLPRLLEAARQDVAVWRTTALEALTLHVLGQPEPPLAAALIQDGRRCRVLDQDVCEELGWFVERLQQTLVPVRCPWLALIAPIAAGRRRPSSRDLALTLSDAPVRRLAAYVETRGPGVSAASATLIERGGGEATIHPTQPVRPDQVGVVGRALRGHPDRRRHRLRQ